MRRVRPALACACAVLAPPAHAAVFQIAQTNPDTWTVMDAQAIQHLPGDVVRRAWSVTVQRHLVSEADSPPGYIRTLNDYDCSRRELRWRVFSVYSRFGVLVLEKTNDQPRWQTAPQGSEGAANLRFVCGGAGQGAAVAAQSLGQLVISLMQAWDEPAAAAAKTPPAKVAAAKPPSKPASKPWPRPAPKSAKPR